MLLKGFVIALVSLSLGFLVGSRNAPVAVDSQLAEAQVVSQDRSVEWIGYQCGDDSATVISRDMPSECKDARRLADDQEFPAPPRRS